MMFKRDPRGFVPGFNVQEEDDVPGFNVRQEDAFPWISVGSEDVDAAQRDGTGVGDDPNVIPAADGDLKCEVCGAGKASGTTGAWRIGGRIHCFNCAVKALGIQNLSGSELAKAMAPFELQRR